VARRSRTIVTLRLCLYVALAMAALVTRGGAATTPADTIISNTASMTYTDLNGVAASVTSNTVTATVSTVSAVTVGPNEQGCNPATDAAPVKVPFVRTFTITNGGNLPDAFTVTAATSAGTIASLALVSNGVSTPLTNGTALPSVAPGATVQVAVTVNPGSATAGTDIEVSLVALSSLAGAATSTAQQCAVLVTAAAITGPGGPGTPILKLVNGQPSVSAQPGATATYSVQFMNSGMLPASDVVIVDTVPAGITPSAASVMIGGVAAASGEASVAGQTLTITIPSVAAGAQEVVTFTATVSPAATVGTTLVNTLSVSSAQGTAQQSTLASVLIGTGNIVYDAVGGPSVPVPGATVSIAQTNGKPVTLAGTAIAPNLGNVDPFVTVATGAYSFGLGPKQIGPGTYVLTVTAPGYLPRKFQLTLTPNAAGTLYTVTVSALDGELLAVAGGFALTSKPPTLANVYGLFGNLPMFRAQNIAVTKTVDRNFAASGDRLVYTLTFANVGASLATTTIVDTLPPNVVYAPGTGRVDNVREEPKIAGRVLTWKLPTLATQHTIMYAAVILPGTEENTTLTNNVTVSAAAPNEPGATLSGSAFASTAVVAGVFTDQTIITGRVFYDIRKTGEFDPGDIGIAGVRIYLEDGESIVTDSTGRYDFPGVRPGMHVLKLDVTTLPPTAKAYDDKNFSFDDQRSIRRLVHGVFDGGIMQDINFALEGSP
jgi:uncharacterized repeat protein (TIGR01451 family)